MAAGPYAGFFCVCSMDVCTQMACILLSVEIWVVHLGLLWIRWEKALS